ncbi:MAG: fused MFS/spermidine synthase [Planctomycetota bacterium]
MATLEHSRPIPGPHCPRVSLALLAVAWGAQAILAQSLLLREALVLMFGSEFAWGIVLFAWLLGVAIGGLLGGRLAAWRRPDILLVATLVGLSVATGVEIWLFRSARGWLDVAAGELLPLPTTALVALLFIPPASALVGMAFPLACRLVQPADGQTGEGAGPLGRIYALESAGSLIGGAAFSFWAVEHLAPIEAVLGCGAITLAACAALLFMTSGKGRYLPVCLSIGAAAALCAAVFAGDFLDHQLVECRWRTIAPGYELCAEAESRHQNLAIGRRLEQYTLYCDGKVSTDFPDPYSYVPLAHFWMCQHPRPNRVLVLGGGAEGLLAEILRHPIERVDYVEPDPRQIALIKPFLPEVDRIALADRRVTVHYQDARFFIKAQRGVFDLVIARLPEPTSALHARFYTDEFYAELRRAMTGAGVFCTTVAAAPGEFTEASAEYVASVRATLRRNFPEVVLSWGNPAHVLAATRTGLISIDPEELIRRYVERGVQSDLFNLLWFEGATDWFDPDKVRRRAAELGAVVSPPISTDLRPTVYMQRLVMWERMTGGREGGFIEHLRSVRWNQLVAAVAAVCAIVVIGCRIRGGPRAGWTSGAIVLSVGTTGFVTMALSIIWLFAFQNLYGYVYQRIGWIIAIFMGGLVIGCWLVNQSSKRISPATRLSIYLWRRLIAVDVLLAALALAVPFALPALASMQTLGPTLAIVEWTISILVAATGVLGGASFALAGGLQLAASRHIGAAAGSIVGADHAGACAGALVTGILLVPIFGTSAAAMLLIAMKLVSVAVLMPARLALPDTSGR